MTWVLSTIREPKNLGGVRGRREKFEGKNKGRYYLGVDGSERACGQSFPPWYEMRA